MTVYKNRHSYSATNDEDIYVENDYTAILIIQHNGNERSNDIICINSLSECNTLIEYLTKMKEEVFKENQNGT